MLLIGPLAGSRTNRITTPMIAVVVTTGMKNAERSRPTIGSLGEFSTMASSRLSSTRAGTTSSMNSSVILNEFQKNGSANTAR